MRKYSIAAAVAALALTGLAGSARADLTVTGEVGLPLNPTAQIPEGKGIRLQGNYFDSTGGELYGLVAAGRAGTAPVEINGGYLRASGGGDSTNGFTIGAKYLISKETDPAGVRLAAGVGYYKLDELKNTRAYFVASKYFGELIEGKAPITGHLGLRYDNFKGFGNSSNKASVYAGVEVPVTPDGQFQFVGELATKTVDGGGTPYSASLRYRPQAQPFGASLGIARNGAFDNKGRFFAQIGYTFGG